MIEGFTSIRDCDDLIRKAGIHHREQQVLKTKGLFAEELDSWGKNAYPIADAHTFTVKGMRWFVRDIQPGKGLYMGFTLKGRAHGWTVDAHGLKHFDWEVYHLWEHAIDFGAFLVREWPRK